MPNAWVIEHSLLGMAAQPTGYEPLQNITSRSALDSFLTLHAEVRKLINNSRKILN